VDILFTTNPVSARVARTASSTIPIVFTGAGDPLGQGLIQSFARPGRNLTGITDLDLQLDPKRLEVFQEMIPGLKRALYPYDPSDNFSGAQAKGYRDAARRLKIVFIEKPIRTPDEALATFAGIRKSDVDGIVTPRSLALNIPGLAMEATARQGIPTMFPAPWFVERDGLVSYGTDLHESGRMAARLVDKILKGESAAKIPVEVNQKIELVINLKVAKAAGIKIVPEVLYRANRVIQ
jgi:putative ABC transport system substrate-binding protein